MTGEGGKGGGRGFSVILDLDLGFDRGEVGEEEEEGGCMVLMGGGGGRAMVRLNMRTDY